MIRAYHTRDPKTGADGPWLAGMTLNPADTSEAWCHQRTGDVCFIHEVGERPVKAGESFGAAYIVGWFDRIKPTLSKKQASATPPAFREALLQLAESCS